MPLILLYYVEGASYWTNYLFIGWLHDDIQLAAYQICGIINSVNWYTIMGTETSLITFVGNSAGAGLRHTAQNYAKLGATIGFTIIACSIIIIHIVKESLAAYLLPEASSVLLGLLIIYNNFMQPVDMT